jgi:hypothetical protein
LTQTVEGEAIRFEKMPCGPIGFIKRDDGKIVCFDAGGDIQLGKIEIELLGH